MQGFFGFLAFAAFAAFIIAMIKPEKMVFWGNKKTRGRGCLYLVAMIIFIIISSASGGSEGGPVASKDNAATSSAEPSSAAPINADSDPTSTPSSAAPSAAPTTQPYSATLLPGFYEIGIDIPAGTYDFEIASGSGNVIDVDDGVNLIMGKASGDIYQQSYKNAELTEGSTLVLSQCSIKISSEDASTNLTKRDNSSAKEFSIASSGKYKVGRDFQSGYYDINLESGSGNVICMDNGLNAIMSADSNLGVTEYKNVKFEDGNVLEVEGPKLQLTPSK